MLHQANVTLAQTADRYNMHFKTDPARIHWLDSNTPWSEEFQDVFFSDSGGLQESSHVFLEGNDLANRFASTGTDAFVIGELGFGSGLNFLLCWRLWQKICPHTARLHYLAFEKHPLDRQSLNRILLRWPELDSFRDSLISCYPDHSRGTHRLHPAKGITLDIHFGDALESLAEAVDNWPVPVDCWFLDGFSPARNPALWSLPLFRAVANASGPNTTLSSYSVAGEVRRNLQACGFEVSRRPGAGRKREMLAARFAVSSSTAAGKQDASAGHPTWFRLPYRIEGARTAAVVGAGLAGSLTALRLAIRGWEVIVCEAGDVPAAGASGNQQAALHCRLARNDLPATSFQLAAFLYAARMFTTLAHPSQVQWHGNGVLLVETDPTELARGSWSDYYNAEIVQHLTADQATAAAGIPLQYGGSWQPLGGWLDPVRLCHYCLEHPGISLKLGFPVTALARESGRWLLRSSNGKSLVTDVVILANGHHGAALPQTAGIPLQPVRGQVTEIKANNSSRQLQCVIAGKRYICPAQNGVHTAGASYRSGNTDTTATEQENLETLDLLTSLLPLSPFQPGDIINARAAIRCTTPDQFPVVGPVPELLAMNERFAGLRRNARAVIDQQPVYHPGLYINSGHGSFGLASCPLAAEYLASLLSGEIPPIGRGITDALHPARFLIRRLQRQQDNLEP